MHMVFTRICQISKDFESWSHFFFTKIELSKEFGTAFYIENYRWFWRSYSANPQNARAVSHPPGCLWWWWWWWRRRRRWWWWSIRAILYYMLFFMIHEVYNSTAIIQLSTCNHDPQWPIVICEDLGQISRATLSRIHRTLWSCFLSRFLGKFRVMLDLRWKTRVYAMIHGDVTNPS